VAALTPQRVGILGGTFDPIHIAHLRCAEEAREALGLDRVLFVPAAAPPHKRGRRITSARHRLAMVRRALAGNPALRASDIELGRRGPSYSIDTLHQLRAASPTQTRFVLLMGLDTFREIGTWKQYRQLFELTDVAVLTRPAYRQRTLRAALPVAARGDFCYSADRESLLHRSGNRVDFLTVTALDISASDIRRRLQRGLSVRYLVPRSVDDYIRRQRLYARGSE
jgi:nicotinate-nucleotide adenylyltransferase